MPKYTPTLTAEKFYVLSLVAVNHHDKKCDLIWSYLDDDGDEMLVREWTDDFEGEASAWYEDAKGRDCEYRETYDVLGGYSLFDKLAGLVVESTLELKTNPKTGRQYTRVCGGHRPLPPGKFRMCSHRPDFWLTGDAYYGIPQIAKLDERHERDMKDAEQEAKETAEWYENGGYDEWVEAKLS